MYEPIYSEDGISAPDKQISIRVNYTHHFEQILIEHKILILIGLTKRFNFRLFSWKMSNVSTQKFVNFRIFFYLLLICYSKNKRMHSKFQASIIWLSLKKKRAVSTQ
jgi:hypothetical protein